MPKVTRNGFIYFAFNWFRDPLKNLGHIFGAMQSENSLEQISFYGFIIKRRKIIQNKSLTWKTSKQESEVNLPHALLSLF